ncbi:hypothetical protein GIB67_010545 [Kingdonia uniflora]|uniref:3-hydroxyisobutyrate dehydrogenase-like NAD-binding domain-containing protein n=1 Tax=Kingdonia uniflora TaxID=39325 RepID=A0A7J7MAQ6_9MAGN|nr:hypothetical protein GIB67_010545 [Kingdonia uniflora]
MPVLRSPVVEEISQHDALMYIVTHIRASLSSSVVDEMEEEEVKEGFVLVARKGCFGLPTTCSSCLPVYLYLRFANVDFNLRFNLVHPDSGDKALYDMVSPFLDIMGKSRFYLGDVGNGTAMKLVVNMIMGSMMASFSEGLLLSEKVGLDPKILVVSQGVISAPMFSMKGISMVKSKYATTFPLKLQSKYPTAFPLKHQHKFLSLDLRLHLQLSIMSKITSFIGSPDSVMDLPRIYICDSKKRICKIMTPCPKAGLETSLNESGIRVSAGLGEDVLKRFLNAGIQAYRFFEWAAAFNRLLSTCCKSKNIWKAQEIFDKMKDKFSPDSKTYSILLEGWGKSSNLPKAREIFRMIADNGCNPNIVTYGIMVDVLCKAGRVDEALEVIGEMDCHGCKPTSFIHSEQFDKPWRD